MKKISIITILLILCTTVNCAAYGAYYLPDVTSEMSSPSFWTDETDVLLSFDEIDKLNAETIQTKGTNMYDLKNLPDVVDGISLNEAIKKSSQADAQYYLGWTYLESTEKATQEDYDKIIEHNIVIRSRKEADKIRIPKRNCTKLLRKVYNEKHILPSNRSRLAIIARDDGEIIWAEEVGVDQKYSVSENTKQAIRITVLKD